jgi:hypothetical protein
VADVGEEKALVDGDVGGVCGGQISPGSTGRIKHLTKGPIDCKVTPSRAWGGTISKAD